MLVVFMAIQQRRLLQKEQPGQHGQAQWKVCPPVGVHQFAGASPVVCGKPMLSPSLRAIHCVKEQMTSQTLACGGQPGPEGCLIWGCNEKTNAQRKCIEPWGDSPVRMQSVVQGHLHDPAQFGFGQVPMPLVCERNVPSQLNKVRTMLRTSKIARILVAIDTPSSSKIVVCISHGQCRHREWQPHINHEEE